MRTLLFILISFSPLFVLCQDIKTIAGNGTAGFSGDGGSCLSAEMAEPNTLAFDKSGNMYITDNDNYRIRKVSRSGIITTVAGNGVNDYAGDNGPATLAELNLPNSIAVDSLGNIYIGTDGDQRIRKVNTAGIITTIAGTGIGGYNGDNMPATSAELGNPVLGAIDREGNLYFSDDDNRRVRKISASGIITTIAGNGMSGDSGDGGPATAATFDGPTFLSMKPNGDIFVPDDYGHCVRMINTAGIITTFAGNRTGGVVGDGIPATDASLNFPNGVAFDNSGNVYIADFGANVVRKVNSSGIISTVAGTGVAGYSGDGGPATLAEITPNTLAVDASGNVYIADVHNNRIRRITYNATAVNNVINTPQNITISPNPATNTITISTGDKIENITITNMVGQAIYNQLYYKVEKTDVEVAGWAAGIYFIKVNGVYAGKFVKE